MYQNYFKIAARNLSRYKNFSIINIAGLAVGMACFILILLFVIDELSYDRFHEKSDRIYRVGQVGNIGDRQFKGTTTQAPLARTLIEEFPEVENAVRLYKGINTVIKYEDKSFFETRYIYVDSTFFDVFSFPLVKGDPGTALSRPRSMVITESIAAKYFGDEEPVGKMIHEADGTNFTVTGVAKDPPRNSHFHFDFLASINTVERTNSENWLSDYLHTYIVLQEDFPAEKLEKKLPDFITRHMGPQIMEALGITMDDWFTSGNSMNYFIEPLTSIYLHSDATHQIEPIGNITYVYFFSAIAFFILLLACINFTNLMTAKSSIRAREVGMRKVMGSQRSSLVRQFLTETIFLTAIAFLVALVFVELLLPTFNNITGKELSVEYLRKWYIIPGFIFMILLVGFVAGSYSAFSISSFRILTVLRGEITSGPKKAWFRNGLVVFQFSISIAIIICTMVVYSQLQYIRNKKMGFVKEDVLVIDRAYGLDEKVETFKNLILEHQGVKYGSITSAIPGNSGWDGTVFQREDSPTEELFHFRLLRCDYDVVETFGYEMAEGRFFSRKFISDSLAFVINESAAKNLGFKDPVGMNIIEITDGPKNRIAHKIIGIVKDFHFKSMHEPIENLVMYMPRSYFPLYLSFRIDPRQSKDIIKQTEKVWKKLVPEEPFHYFFLEDNFRELHKTEYRTGKIFSIFSVLAIFIASLGLLGLASFMAEQRTREIGIRKVLGASVSHVVRLLSKRFIKWVILANLIAWPAAYYLMNRWLQNFAYRTELPWWSFLAAGLIAIILALVTVSYQTFTTARQNPARVIMYE